MKFSIQKDVKPFICHFGHHQTIQCQAIPATKMKMYKKLYESFSKCHIICFCMRVSRSGGGERQNLLSVRDS